MILYYIDDICHQHHRHMIQYSLLSTGMHEHGSELPGFNLCEFITGAKDLHDTWLCSCCTGVCEKAKPTQHVLLLPACSVAWPTIQCAAQVPAQLQQRMRDTGVDTALTATSSAAAAAVPAGSEWLSIECMSICIGR